MEIDPKQLTSSQAYDLMISIVIPRPIAFISTLNSEGVPNAAPFSFFNGISTDPPMVAISIARRGTEKKGTLRNIETTGEFVVNMVDEALAEGMNRAAGNYPPNTNKLEAAGLTARPSVKVKPPRIGEAPISLECRVVQVLPLPESKDALVIGRVVYIYLKDDLWRNGTVDPARLRAIGRLGQSNYCRIRDVFKLERPQTG
ncbi:MAG TPA: flavin reductase family protein [Nitrospiria bacterium]|jgi:flavin reductase (DIM6/NTAB) family NADH-FMN oxidoreductase RutF|nr:flavin reductase family protein [Nitrospiria bacterium]